jgi:phage baseplate assembly protein W
MSAVLGIDLSVLAGPAAHDATSTDLSLRHALHGRGVRAIERTDLRVVAGRDNLAQALILRLLTPLGTLRALGHAGYGSRLHELIGREKTPALRHLCRAFVLEAIAQERRVQPKAVSFEFDPTAEGPSDLCFTVAVRPIAGGDAIGLTLEVAL